MWLCSLALLCSLAMLSEASLSKALLRNKFLQQRSDIGEGACASNPCVNGVCCDDPACLEGNSTYACYCDLSYSGPTCSDVCSLSECLYDFMRNLSREKEVESESGSAELSEEAAYSEESAEELRSVRSNIRKSKGKARALRSLAKKLDKEDEWSLACRKAFPSLVSCMENAFKSYSFCKCDKDTIDYILKDTMYAESPAAREAMYCDSGEECKQAGATDCVEIVNFLFGDEEFRSSDLPKLLEGAEACVQELVDGKLSVEGCVQNAWMKDPSTLFLIKAWRAAESGCDVDYIQSECDTTGYLCGDLDVVCLKTAEEKTAIIEEIFACGRKVAESETGCEGLMDSLEPLKPLLVKEADVECGKNYKVQKVIESCKKPKKPGQTLEAAMLNILRKIFQFRH